MTYVHLPAAGDATLQQIRGADYLTVGAESTQNLQRRFRPPRQPGNLPRDCNFDCKLGLQLITTAAHINKVGGLSCGRVSGLLERLFGATVGRSGLARSLGRLAERGEPSYEILKAQLKGAPVVYPDETGWKIGGRNAWLQSVACGIMAHHSAPNQPRFCR